MRLYNAHSCTPVITSSSHAVKRSQWAPPPGVAPKVPWGQDMLKKRNQERVDLHKPYNREKSQVTLSRKASWASKPSAPAFDPFDLGEATNRWPDSFVKKGDGSPQSNKGSTRTNATTSTDEMTPDVPAEHPADTSGFKEHTGMNAEDFLQAGHDFKAERRQDSQRMEEKLLLSPIAASLAAPSDDSSLTSASTFYSTSSHSDDINSFLDHSLGQGSIESPKTIPRATVTFSAPSSPILNTISPTDYQWPPKTCTPKEGKTVGGFPLFDIDSISSSSSCSSERTPLEEVSSRESLDGGRNSTTSRQQMSEGVRCQLDSRFVGATHGVASWQKTTKSAPSFVPSKAAGPSEDFLAVRAKLKKVNTTRGGPFRAHPGISPPPKEETRPDAHGSSKPQLSIYPTQESKYAATTSSLEVESVWNRESENMGLPSREAEDDAKVAETSHPDYASVANNDMSGGYEVTWEAHQNFSSTNSNTKHLHESDHTDNSETAPSMKGWRERNGEDIQVSKCVVIPSSFDCPPTVNNSRSAIPRMNSPRPSSIERPRLDKQPVANQTSKSNPRFQERTKEKESKGRFSAKDNPRLLSHFQRKAAPATTTENEDHLHCLNTALQKRASANETNKDRSSIFRPLSKPGNSSGGREEEEPSDKNSAQQSLSKLLRSRQGHSHHGRTIGADAHGASSVDNLKDVARSNLTNLLQSRQGHSTPGPSGDAAITPVEREEASEKESARRSLSNLLLSRQGHPAPGESGGADARGTSSDDNLNKHVARSNLTNLLQSRQRHSSPEPSGDAANTHVEKEKASEKDSARRNLSNLLLSRQGHSAPGESCGADARGTSSDDNLNGDVVRSSLSNLLQTRQRHSTPGPSVDAARIQTLDGDPPQCAPAYENLSTLMRSRKNQSTSGGAGNGVAFHKDSSNQASQDISFPAQNVGASTSNVEACQAQEGVALKDDPVYSKYFKMLKLGLPMGAVQNAMQRDGLDPSVLDGDHEAPAPCGGKSSLANDPTPKDTHRRTRLHWHTHNKVRANTLWAKIVRDPDVSGLKIDEGEFISLFQTELKPPVNVTQATKSGDETAVKVIDRKRANNGGIILARIKLTYDELARAVDTFDNAALTPEQIRGVIQLLPTKEEKRQLTSYLSRKDTSIEALCECEKFMVAMMNVPHAKRKLDALLFMQKFSSSAEELRHDAHLVQLACEEITSSARFRKILGIILSVGNRLNTAGSSKKAPAGAITLDSLLMLNQARAFDRKTTFLHYLARLVRRNNPDLMQFKDDMPSIFKAQRIYWDLTLAELATLENELDNVRRIALFHGGEICRWESDFNDRRDGDSDTLCDEILDFEEEIQRLQASTVGLFTLDACSQIALLVDAVESSKQKHMQLLQYFGEEDREDLKPHEMFQMIATFCKNFDDATEEVIADEKVKIRQSRANSNSLGMNPSYKVDGGVTVEYQSPRKTFRSNMGSVMSELRNKSKKKIRWGKKRKY